MKKFSLFLLALLLITIFFRQSNIQKPLKMVDYIPDKSFTFLTFYNSKDTFYKQKICSMIDQVYDNFQILLLVDEENENLLNEVKIYAKKKNKGHLLHLRSRNENVPLAAVLKEEAAKMNKESVIVYLEKDCVLTSSEILSRLNDIYCASNNPIFVYANHTDFPSLRENTKEINYSASRFKTFYAEDLQTISIDKLQNKTELKDMVNSLPYEASRTHFIKESLYLLAL